MKDVFKLVCGSLLQEIEQRPCAAEKKIQRKKSSAQLKGGKKGKIIFKTPLQFSRVDYYTSTKSKYFPVFH